MIKKIICPIHTWKGPWTEGTSYPSLSRVSWGGSVFQSIIDGNTAAPGTLSAAGELTVGPGWELVSAGHETEKARVGMGKKVDKVPGKTLTTVNIDTQTREKITTATTVAEPGKTGLMSPSSLDALSGLNQKIEDHFSYGVIIDSNVSSPQLKRIGNPDLHRSLPIQSEMKGCLLSDIGEVLEWLPDSDWTGAARDGSKGQVMVKIPGHYAKFTTKDNIKEVRLSTMNLPGYHYVPTMYVSAYEATIQRSTGKLCSVVNMDPDYRGGNNNADRDGTAKTQLGVPATAISRTNFRKYARKRKLGSSEWNCMTYDVQKTLYWLFVVEYSTLNTQAAYNAVPTAEGYKQGGLGAGVTDLNGTKWGAFNGYFPFVSCGYTDSLGNGTGVIPFVMPTEYDAAGFTTNVPRYHGIENPFGHIWQWTDGINIRISPTVENGGDGLSKVFVCKDPALFKDNGYEGYSHVGNEARNEGYVKEIIGGEYGDIMPAVCSGAGSTTYFCDYHYTNVPTRETLRGVLFGGHANNGASAGFVYATTNPAATSTYANVGSRLCYLPQDEINKTL